MITDKVLIPVLQHIPLCASKSNTDNSKYYCSASYNKKSVRYHNFITNLDMTDHINNNSLDNRLINLRWTDYSENNRNKTTNSECTGVRKIEHEEGNIKYYEVRAKYYGKQMSKFFHYKTHGEKTTAKENSHMFRKNMFEIDIHSDNVQFTGLETIDDINFAINYTQVIMNKMKKSIENDVNNYLKDINITDAQKRLIYDKYLHIQNWRLVNLKNRIKILKQYIDILSNTSTDLARTIKIQNKCNYDTKYSVCSYNDLCKSTNTDNILTTATTKSKTKKKDIKINDNTISKENYNEILNIIKLKMGVCNTKYDSVIDSNTDVNITCSKGHTFTLSYNDIVKKFLWCNNCKVISKGEKKLNKILCEIFNEKFVKTRPLWLKNKNGNNMELDMFNDKLKLAFEYNGKQHFEYNPTFHKSKDSFKQLQENDKIKNKICSKNNITLITVPYTINNNKIKTYILDKLNSSHIEPTKQPLSNTTEKI